ncbi:TetR/AcrR family transcriptional regulator [Mycobacterium avium]|uniref:TetR/AcrR family transcriptional regulator n=1 Tax=Mycobacterium avium TaxID=1764 RepID=UPI0007A07630|nr:TetR/AcrR family transcriptional regulator [Mycobacterium avium]
MPAHKQTARSGNGGVETAATATRPRGRPRKKIDLGEVADAVAALFAERGHEGVSIEAVAERLTVSRATLYRTVPTKEELLGILFERSTGELYKNARGLIAATSDPADALFGLIRLHVSAAIEMRHYLTVFFGGADLPPDVYFRWRRWSRDYEKLWVKVVREAMKSGVLEAGNPQLTTRLLLGMVIWVSRWYRPSEGVTADEIAEEAMRMVRAR